MNPHTKLARPILFLVLKQPLPHMNLHNGLTVSSECFTAWQVSIEATGKMPSTKPTVSTSNYPQYYNWYSFMYTICSSDKIALTCLHFHFNLKTTLTFAFDCAGTQILWQFSCYGNRDNHSKQPSSSPQIWWLHDCSGFWCACFIPRWQSQYRWNPPAEFSRCCHLQHYYCLR